MDSCSRVLQSAKSEDSHEIALFDLKLLSWEDRFDGKNFYEILFQRKLNDLDFQEYTYFNFDGSQVVVEIDTVSFAEDAVDQDLLDEEFLNTFDVSYDDEELSTYVKRHLSEYIQSLFKSSPKIKIVH